MALPVAAPGRRVLRGVVWLAGPTHHLRRCAERETLIIGEAVGGAADRSRPVSAVSPIPAIHRAALPRHRAARPDAARRRSRSESNRYFPRAGDAPRHREQPDHVTHFLSGNRADNSRFVSGSSCAAARRSFVAASRPLGWKSPRLAHGDFRPSPLARPCGWPGGLFHRRDF